MTTRRERPAGPARLLLGRAAVGALAAGFAVGIGAVPGAMHALHAAPEGESKRIEETASISASNGVVIHGVDSKLLAARIREIDAKVAAGDAATAARELADLASADLTALVEDAEGAYLSADEAVLQRVGALPADGLAAYRGLLDARADAAIDAARKRPDLVALSREATRLVHTTRGMELLAALADLRMARGDLDGAARALEDALRHRTDAGPLRVAIVSRLAAIHASSGDLSSVRGLLSELPGEQSAAPSPIHEGKSIRAEIELAATAAQRIATGRDDSAPGPSRPLRLAAETPVADPPSPRERSTRFVREPETIPEHPILLTRPGSDGAPTLLARFSKSRGRQIGVTALRFDAASGQLERAWNWPEAGAEAARTDLSAPFSPARVTVDTVAFPWPGDDGARNELVLLRTGSEPRISDLRGAFEPTRDTADRLPPGLSFEGRPTVVRSGTRTSLYASLIAQPDLGRGGLTQLHVARFDVVEEGEDTRLVLRWIRHVLDGTPVPPALLPVHQTDFEPRPARPSSPCVLAGRVFVCSNSGAVAALDASSGRVEWVETYRRYGPSQRITVVESETRSWNDVPVTADGPWLFAAPRDSESLLQLRRAPRRARSVRIEEFPLHAPTGTANLAGRLFPDFLPDDVPAVRGGIAFLAGRVPDRGPGAISTQATPLAAFDLVGRTASFAQIEEYAPAGRAAFSADAVYLGTTKAIYRAPLGDLEASSRALWTSASLPDGKPREIVGNLVLDGTRVWSVTPRTVAVFVEDAGK